MLSLPHSVSAPVGQRAPHRERTLTERASLTAVATLLDYATKVGVGVLITPVLVGYLGKPLFGAWEMVVRAIGYMSLADGRPMDALRLVLASRHAQVDDETNRRTAGMAVGVWLLCLPVAVSVGGVLVWAAPTLTNAPAYLVDVVRITAALLLVNTLLSMLVALPEAVLFGVNQGYRRMGLVAAANVVTALITLIVVRMGLGLIGLAVGQVVLTLMTAAMFLVLVRRYVPWFGVARPSVPELRWFARLSGWGLAGDALARLLLASDVILLGWFASTTVVTSYVLTGYAAQSIIGVLTLALSAVVPGLASVVGLQQYRRAAALRHEMLTIAWLSATVVGSTILLWNQSFLRLWIGPGYYAGPLANFLLVVVMVQTVFIRSDAYVINAALRLRARVLISLPAAVLTCASAAFAVPRWGIAGMCLSLLAGRLTQSIAYPVVVQSALRGPGPAVGRMARAAAVTGLMFAASLWLGQRVVAANWPIWLAGVTASVLAFAAVAMFAGIGSHDRAPLLLRVRSIRFPVLK